MIIIVQILIIVLIKIDLIVAEMLLEVDILIFNVL